MSTRDNNRNLKRIADVAMANNDAMQGYGVNSYKKHFVESPNKNEAASAPFYSCNIPREVKFKMTAANPHVDKDQIIDEFDRNGPSEDALLEALEKAEQRKTGVSFDEFDRNGPSEDALLEALEKAEQRQK